jgi:hypothetical protein
MSARAVAVIRPAANIIARLAFLCILSGQGQLHAHKDLSDLRGRSGDLALFQTHSPRDVR